MKQLSFNELRALLLRYGTHEGGCRIRARMSQPCNCGWAAARVALDKTLAQP